VHAALFGGDYFAGGFDAIGGGVGFAPSSVITWPLRELVR